MMPSPCLLGRRYDRSDVLERVPAATKVREAAFKKGTRAARSRILCSCNFFRQFSSASHDTGHEQVGVRPGQKDQTAAAASSSSSSDRTAC